MQNTKQNNTDRNFSARIIHVPFCPCLIFMLFISSSLFSQVTEYPRLVLNQASLNFPGLMQPTANISYGLSGESRERYDTYFERSEELKKEFEEKATVLENAYNAAIGETKINKALELINLVIEYRKLFDELWYSDLGEFQGDYDLDLKYNSSIIQIDIEAKGTGYINFSSGGYNDATLISGKLSGSVKGNSTFSVSAGYGFVNMIGSTDFKDSISGYYTLGCAYIRQKSYIEHGAYNITGGIPDFMIIDSEFRIIDNETTGWIAVGFPGMLSYFTMENGLAKGDVYVLDKHGFYHAISVQNPYVEEDIYAYYDMFLVEPNIEEVPFQELIDKYYTYYVTSLNSERLTQYNGMSDYQEKASKAKTTLDDLVNAYYMADRIGVTPGVTDALKLLMRIPNSLFDYWFERAFKSNDNANAENISSASIPDVKEQLYLDRINDAISYRIHGEMLVSDELLDNIKLYRGSTYFNQIILDYFHFAQPQKCRLSDSEYQTWMQSVLLGAISYADQSVVNTISNTNCI